MVVQIVAEMLHRLHLHLVEGRIGHPMPTDEVHAAEEFAQEFGQFFGMKR